MKVNWKVRFKNKVFLTSFLSVIVTFVFTMLRMFDIAPAITESAVMNVISNILMMLGILGVIVDPTTSGVGDSDRALGYEEPWEDSDSDEPQE